MSKKNHKGLPRNPIAEGHSRKTGNHAGFHKDELPHLVEKGIERKSKHKKQQLEKWINGDDDDDDYEYD